MGEPLEPLITIVRIAFESGRCCSTMAPACVSALLRILRTVRSALAASSVDIVSSRSTSRQMSSARRIAFFRRVFTCCLPPSLSIQSPMPTLKPASRCTPSRDAGRR